METAGTAQVEVDGIKYHTLLELPPNGNIKAPTILLVHALMSSSSMWDSTVRTLNAAGYKTLRYDHIGHQDTPPPRDSNAAYNLDDLTRHAHHIAQARTGEQHVKAVIGCSIGGVIAMRYAMLFPSDVEKIISIAAPGFTSPEATKPLWTQRIEQFENDVQSGDDVLARQTVARWFPGDRPEDEAVREESLKHVKACSLQGYKVLADAIRGYDYDSELESVKVECLICGGTEDGAINLETLEDAASKVKGARFVRLEGAGHLPPMQQPEVFGKLALSFLQE